MTTRLSRSRYRWISLAICLAAVVLTALLVAGVLPGYVGTIAFIAGSAWIVYGLWSARASSASRRDRGHPDSAH